MYSATPQSARIQEAGQGLSCKSLQRGTFITASLTVTWSDRYLNQKCIMEVHIVTSYHSVVSDSPFDLQPHPNQLWPRREDGWEHQHKNLPQMVL